MEDRPFLSGGVVMDALWFEVIRFYELPLAKRWNLLLAQREKLYVQQTRLELLQQELAEQQTRLEQKRQAFIQSTGQS